MLGRDAALDVDGTSAPSVTLITPSNEIMLKEKQSRLFIFSLHFLAIVYGIKKYFFLKTVFFRELRDGMDGSMQGIMFQNTQ